MATRDMVDASKKTGLECLSRSELDEKFITEIFTYRTRLLSVSSEEGRDCVTEEYMKRTEALRAEIDGREQLYLEGHRMNIRY